MKLANLKSISALAILNGLATPAALAHPGHAANETVHSLLHAEHVIALVITGVVALALLSMRNK